MARILRTDRFPAVVRRVGDAQQPGYSIACRTCPETGFMARSSDRHLPPEVIARKFAERGWEIGNAAGKDRCPYCAAQRKAEIKALDNERRERAAAKDSAMQKTDMIKAVAPPHPKGALPSDDAFAKTAEVYIYLVDHYDRGRRCYKPGWSDQKIADSVGCSVALVADRRAKECGPATSSDEDIRAAIADMQARQKTISTQITALVESYSVQAIKLDALAKLADSLGKA